MAGIAGTAATPRKRLLPGWLVAALIYLILGVVSLVIIYIIGPFRDDAPKVPEPQTRPLEITTSGLTNQSIRLLAKFDYRTTEGLPHLTKAELTVEVTAGTPEGFDFEQILLADRRPTSSRTVGYGPLPCQAVATKVAHQQTSALPIETLDALPSPSAANDPSRNRPGAYTKISGSDSYKSLLITCDVTSHTSRTNWRAVDTYIFPPISLMGDDVPLTIKTVMSRDPHESLVNSSRPPDLSDYNSFEWTEYEPTIQRLIVSVTNPSLQSSREQSLFLWGLFSGITGAFFVAAIQEIMNRLARGPAP